MLVNHIDCNRGRIESILYIHTFIANDDDEDILELDDDDIHNNADLASNHSIIATMTSVCVSYNTSIQEPNYAPSHVTAPTLHPGKLDIILQKNTNHQPVCFSSAAMSI